MTTYHKNQNKAQSKPTKKAWGLTRSFAIFAITAICGSLLWASPASADVFDDADCFVRAVADRQDGTTNTYGMGYIRCDQKVLDATEINVRLYRDGILVDRGYQSCGTPVHNYCAASTGLFSGSSQAEWKVVVEVDARIPPVSREFTDTDTL